MEHIREIFRLLHWEYDRIQLHYLFNRMKSLTTFHCNNKEWFLSRYHQKPDILILWMEIRKDSHISVNKAKEHCCLCSDTGLISVYNYKYPFPAGFHKETLLRMAYRNCATEIPCPECGDKTVFERYLQGLKNCSELDRQIMQFYMNTYYLGKEIDTKSL